MGLSLKKITRSIGRVFKPVAKTLPVLATVGGFMVGGPVGAGIGAGAGRFAQGRIEGQEHGRDSLKAATAAGVAAAGGAYLGGPVGGAAAQRFASGRAQTGGEHGKDTLMGTGTSALAAYGLQGALNAYTGVATPAQVAANQANIAAQGGLRAGETWVGAGAAPTAAAPAAGALTNVGLASGGGYTALSGDMAGGAVPSYAAPSAPAPVDTSWMSKLSNLMPTSGGTTSPTTGTQASPWSASEMLKTGLKYYPLATTVMQYSQQQEQAKYLQKMIDASDPFGPERAKYQAELDALLANPASIKNEPGYQFALQEGESAIDRALASQGKYYSGGRPAELARYAEGLASSRFDNAVSRLSSLAGANIAPSGAGMTGALNLTQANKQNQLELLTRLGIDVGSLLNTGTSNPAALPQRTSSDRNFAYGNVAPAMIRA